MQNACSSCGAGIAGANVLFTAEGATVCQVCFDKADVKAIRARGMLGDNGPLGIAIAVGLIPFFFSLYSVTSSGTGVVYRDYFAISCGAVTAAIAGVALRAALRSQVGSRIALSGAVLMLGVFQLVRGFGMGV